MMMKFKERWNVLRSSDGGFTLIETLVTVFLAGIVLSALTAAIITFSNSSQKFTESAATQETVISATTLISREISVSPTFTYASDTRVDFTNANSEFIRYVYYDPAHPEVNLSSAVAGKNPQSVPTLTLPSLLEIRTYSNQSYSTITVLASGIDLNQASTGMPLFTYYNAQNQVMATAVSTSSLGDITRLAIRVVADSPARATPIEVVTSVSPHDGNVSGNATNPELAAPHATVLTGTMPRPTQAANLSWVHVAGATTYTVYRDGSAIATLTDDQTLTYADAGRPWGSTQDYFVVSTGPGGSSAQSNHVSLTTVPQQPSFINIDTTAAVANGNTVARDLDNGLAWTPRSGATGYKLYRGGTLIYTGTNTKYVDSGRAYGETNTYTVIAYNTGDNLSGGDSITSPSQVLISPPLAPTLSGTDHNGDRTLTWVKPTNALKYQLDRTAPTVKTWNIASDATLSQLDNEGIDAATFSYAIRAGNDAGWSPYSNTVSLAPRPSGIVVIGQDFSTNPATRDGSNYASWTAQNATCFEWKNGAGGTITQTTNTYFTDSTPGYGTTNTYYVRGCNPTGYSGWSTVVLKQPPSPFSFTSVSQTKRSGQTALVTGSQSDEAAVNQSLTLDWGDSAGATSYTTIRSGTTVCSGCGSSVFTDGGISPGNAYTYTVNAYAANGLTRSAQYNMQVAPAAQVQTNTRAITTDGVRSGAAFWGNVAPVVGYSSGGQDRLMMVGGPPTAMSIRSDTGWMGWDGAYVRATEYQFSDTSASYWIGGMSMMRTYVNVPGGYSTGSTVISNNFVNGSAKGTGITASTAGNTSWETYMAFRGFGGGRFWGSYDGSQWWDVTDLRNYAQAGGLNYEQVNAH
jgi:prepilin-type N-terminal cleavage/methylation domain-containing protein